MSSLPGFRFDVTGASGSLGLLGPKNSYRAYVFPRGGYAAQDSTGTKITFDSASVASRFSVGNWIQSGLLTSNIRQVGAVGGNSLTVSGAAVTVTENDRIYLIGNTEPTVNGGSATYTTPNTIVRQRDDDAADLYSNSMLTTNADGLVQGFAVTALYDLLIQDSNGANQGSLIDLPVGVPEGISVSDWAIFGATVTIHGALGVTGTAVFGTTTVTMKHGPAHIRYADAFATGSNSGGIQEAINDLPSGGGWVILSANKTYGITAALTTVGGLKLVGGGPTTLIVQSTNATGGFTMTGTPLLFRDFLLRGTSVSGAGAHGFNGGNNSDLLIENCTVERWGKIGINLANGSSRCVVRNCNIQNNLSEGIYAGLSTSEIQILDNLVHGNLDNGIDCIGSNCTVRGNIVYQNGTPAQSSDNHGILIGSGSGYSAQHVICEGNVVRNNNRSGIFVWGGGISVTSIIVRSNTVMNNAVRGIDCEGSAGVTFSRCIISGNIVSGNSDHGILLDGIDDSSITDNVVFGNVSVGIYLTGSAKSCTRNTITGNVSRNNSGRGIYSDSANVTDCIVEGNISTGNGTAQLAFSTGSRNTVRNNKLGTTDTQVITAAATAIVITDEDMKLTADNSYTLSAAPTIADGYDKQRVMIINVDTVDVITLQDQGTLPSSNLRLGAATRALGPRDSIQLQYDSVVGDWVELTFSNVT